MEYKKEDWVKGRFYQFLGGENDDFTCDTFTPGKWYLMAGNVYWYFDNPELKPDAEFVDNNGEKMWACIISFSPLSKEHE